MDHIRLVITHFACLIIAHQPPQLPASSQSPKLLGVMRQEPSFIECLLNVSRRYSALSVFALRMNLASNPFPSVLLYSRCIKPPSFVAQSPIDAHAVKKCFRQLAGYSTRLSITHLKVKTDRDQGAMGLAHHVSGTYLRRSSGRLILFYSIVGESTQVPKVTTRMLETAMNRPCLQLVYTMHCAR